MNDLFSPPRRADSNNRGDDWLDRSLSFGSPKSSEGSPRDTRPGREIEYLFFVLASALFAPLAFLCWLCGYSYYWTVQREPSFRALRLTFTAASSAVLIASGMALLYYYFNPVLEQNYNELQSLMLWKMKLGEKILGRDPYDPSFWFSFTPDFLFDYWRQYRMPMLPFLMLGGVSSLIFGALGGTALATFATPHVSRYRFLLKKAPYRLASALFCYPSCALLFSVFISSSSRALSGVFTSFNMYVVILAAQWALASSIAFSFPVQVVLQFVIFQLLAGCLLFFFQHMIFLLTSRKPSLQPSKEKICFGQDDAGKRWSVPVAELTKHSEVVGPTGEGKTTLMRNIYYQHIRHGRGFVHIDLKARRKDIAELIEMIRLHGREKDILFINLSDPENSCSYNPLAKGDYGELKDKFMGAFNWSEEFYKRAAEGFLQTVLKALVYVRDRKGKIVTLQDLYRCSYSVTALKLLRNEISGNESLKREVDEVVEEMSDPKGHRDLKSIQTNLKILATSSYGSILTDTRPGLDLLDAMLKQKIVLVYLDSQKHMEDAKHLGRLFLSELRVASGTIGEKGLESTYEGCTVVIDEAADFVTDNFVGFLNRARSSKIGIVLSHQSPYDFETKVLKQIEGNTQTAFFFRHDDSLASDQIASSIGTYQRNELTFQTETRPYHRSTGLGSRRVVEAFKIHPNEIKNMQVGYCVFLSRGKAYAKIKVNNIPYPIAHEVHWKPTRAPYPMPELCLNLYDAEILEKEKKRKKRRIFKARW